MSMPHKQFEIWLRRQLFEANEPMTKMVIRHGKATSRLGQILMRIEIPKGDDRDVIDNEYWSDWIRSTINEIEQTTQADADGSSAGVQQYVIQAFHGEDTAKPTVSFNIRVACETDDNDDGILSEPATKSGLLSQLMRHNEALMRSSVMLSAQHAQSAQKQIRNQEHVIEKLLDDKFNNFITMEKLLSEQHTRETESLEAAHRMEVKDKFMDTARLIVPAVANKLLGRGTVPEEISPAEQQILALSQSFTEEQFSVLQKTFSPPQLMALLELISVAQEKSVKALGEGEVNEPSE